MSKKIILASASPRRKELLRKIVKKFTIMESMVDESAISAKTPEQFAVSTATAKAKDIAGKVKNALVIGGDTIVVLDHKILGKPKSKKEAIKMLTALSGRTHTVITGLAVVDSDTLKEITDSEITKVTMKKLSAKAIVEYVESGAPMDKAGSYGIQEIEAQFIASVDGDYDNVVGLPIERLSRMLHSFGVDRR
ncbi:MAG: Maf family protein [Candidatus Saganbacteria bacterium]|nr:Maf family protein [Candidatus Saganbacteria bacterium]